MLIVFVLKDQVKKVHPLVGGWSYLAVLVVYEV